MFCVQNAHKQVKKRCGMKSAGTMLIDRFCH